MNTIIFRTILPVLAAIMLVFSVFVLLRGHNEPGGGFIGGLIAASAIAMYALGLGCDEVRRALHVDPLAIAGLGVVVASLAGFLSLNYDVPFLTGIWNTLYFGGTEVYLSTPLFFDIGVYLVVMGAISAIALALSEEEVEP